MCCHCTCKAGLGEACSHIPALLYALDSAVKHQEDSDGPRQWGLPPVKAGKACYEEGSGTDFSNSAKKHCNANNKVGVSAAAIEKFYRDLDNAAQTAPEKSGLLSLVPVYCNQFQPKTTTASDEGIQPS